MIKVGKYTAALILLTVGGLLLADQITGQNYLSYLSRWWPVVLIALGVEYLLRSLLHHDGERRIKLDLGGVFVAVLISAVVIVGTQAGKFSLDNFKISSFNLFGGENGHRFEQVSATIPVAGDTASVSLENTNGSIVLRQGDVSQIEIQPTVWVNMKSESDAQQVADSVRFDYNASAGALTINAVADEYTSRFGIKQKPTLNLVVTIPANVPLDVQLTTRNGKMEAHDVTVKRQLGMHTTNGSMSVSQIRGGVELESSNGRVEAEDVGGNAQVKTTNGKIFVRNTAGDANLRTTNGEIHAERINGKLTADTTNGRIYVSDARQDVSVDTSNGRIEASSPVVGGNWDLSTTNGAINVRLPEKGDYTVKGATSHGDVSTDLPLHTTKNGIEGAIGAGTYEIKLNTSNSSLKVDKAD